MRYFMTQRPAGPGAMPKEGLVEILPGEQQDWLHHRVYNVLVYSRELTRREVRDYELVPDLPPEQYKGWEIRFLPYTWEWALIKGEKVAYCQSVEEAHKLIDKRRR